MREPLPVTYRFRVVVELASAVQTAHSQWGARSEERGARSEERGRICEPLAPSSSYGEPRELRMLGGTAPREDPPHSLAGQVQSESEVPLARNSTPSQVQRGGGHPSPCCGACTRQRDWSTTWHHPCSLVQRDQRCQRLHCSTRIFHHLFEERRGVKEAARIDSGQL